MSLKILMDGDMLCFRTCSALEMEMDWGDDTWSMYIDLREAKEVLEDTAGDIIEKVLNGLKYHGQYKVVWCFSDPRRNFRKAILPSYKANREGKRKPIGYRGLVDYVRETYNTSQHNSLEADDCIGILATMKNNKGNSVIVSGDKDLKTIPAYYYDFLKGKLELIDERTALFNFYKQTLMGDTADGYKGCPSIGKARAEKLLNNDLSWKAVVSAFQANGQTEMDALMQARVARILQATDYDFKKKAVKLWTPTK